MYTGRGKSEGNTHNKRLHADNTEVIKRHTEDSAAVQQRSAEKGVSLHYICIVCRSVHRANMSTVPAEKARLMGAT